MSKKSATYYQLLDIAYKMSGSLRTVSTSQDTVLGPTYEQTSGPDESVLLNAVAIVDLNVFLGLSAGAVKLLINRLIPEMKRNNVFWYCDGSTDARVRIALAALKRAEIIYMTDNTGYYIVNPFKIRRGKPMATVMASLEALSAENGIQIPIADLRAPKRALLNIAG